ncbi:LysR family transcriptional regulator [Shimia abyssi]|uniref:DNA-binding transcriptional LysR family regulator n=1 Tax=Shimia abyssi TaxID=1662395 RepID=A0A2P8FBP4_9RHOB|nr:LysR family transcriptional regulator [Shimia abyssi]PSL19130.1 DNA-binding transcriptional LysR family regulator [Shimia abyssi]
MITLKDLEFLSALARHKHFARAAEECGVSQPAFSMRIRGLEERLDVAIVRRGNRFQGFTSEGDALIRHARKILGDVQLLEQELRAARGEVTGQLALGVVPTAITHAAAMAGRLRERHPGLTLRIQAATSLKIQQGLENGLYDAGITYTEGISRDVMRVDRLYDEHYLLLAPIDMAPRQNGTATWVEASELPLCLLEPGMLNRRILDNVFGELGLNPTVIAEASGFSALMAMTANGVAATVIPEVLVESLGGVGGAVALPLVEPVLEKELSLVSLNRDPELLVVDALRDACLTD